MNLALSKRLNEIVEQYIPASPGLSESVIEWFNDWQRETSAVDHADLKDEIQDLKLDIKDLKIELKDEIHALEKSTLLIRSEMQEQLHQMEKNTSERFASLEKNILLVRSESKEQFSALEKNFLAFQKTIKVSLLWLSFLVTGLLLPIALPHIQAWFR